MAKHPVTPMLVEMSHRIVELLLSDRNARAALWRLRHGIHWEHDFGFVNGLYYLKGGSYDEPQHKAYWDRQRGRK